MANNNETTTKFKVDISELKNSMQEAKRQIALANSEFKASSSAMHDWANSSDGVKAKLKQLNTTLDAQISVQLEYERTLEEVKQQYGENSKEAQDYQIKLNNHIATVNKTVKELAKYELQLEEIEKAESDVGDEAEDASDSIEDMGDEAKEAEDGFTVLKGAMADLAAEGIKTLIGGIKDLIVNFASLADSTREYREDMGKLKTAFETAGFSAEAATDVYKDFYSFLGEEDRSVEAVNHLAKLVNTEEDLATWTNICTGVWGTFGDSLPIEGLTEAANETAKTGQLTGVLADALNWAGISEDDFQAKLDSLNSEQDRANYIMNTLNGLYSDAADNYRENNGQIMEANKAQSEYNDTLAEMGEAIEPLTTEVKKGVTQLLQELLKLVQDVDMDAFREKIQKAFNVISTVASFVVKHSKAIITVLVAIGAALAAMKIVTLISSTITAIQTLIPVIAMLNGALMTLLANPVVLIIAAIIAAIALLVIGFKYLWDNCEGFRQFWINLWEGIKSTISSVVEWIKKNWSTILTYLINPFAGLFKYFYENNDKFRNFVDNAVNAIKQLPAKCKEWFDRTIQNVSTWASDMANRAKEAGISFLESVTTTIRELPNKVWTWLVNVITKITQWKNDLARKAKEAMTEFVTNVVNTIAELPEKMKKLAADMIDGLWQGIQDKATEFYGKIEGFFSGLVDKAKNALDINSPSKVFAREVGRWIPEGVAVGINANAKSALDAMDNLSGELVASTEGTTLGGGVSGGVNYNFYQTNNSPKALSRLEIYRQSKNLLGYAGGGI